MTSPLPSDTLLYEVEPAELVTGEAVVLDLHAASFILRAAGAIIDFLVYMGSYVLVVFLISLLAVSQGLDSAISTAIGVASLVVCLVVAPMTVELLTQGKSLGKLAVGVRVVRDDGGSIGFRHAFIRALVGVLEIYMTLGGLAAMVGLLNGRSKRLGDLLAGTYGQNERVSPRILPVYGVPLELQAWSTTADVGRMPDALSRRIAHFLQQAGGFTPATRDRLSRQLATEASIYVSPIPRCNAEIFLAAVAAVRREREFAALTLERQGLDRLAPVLGGLPHNFPDRG